MLSDNAPFDKSSTDKLRLHNIIHIRSLSHYPQDNGLNESPHLLVEYAMSTVVMEPDETFQDLLQYAMLAHNCVPHVSTGESPFYLLTGIDPRLPGWEVKRLGRGPPA